jgi:hypothetical protein
MSKKERYVLFCLTQMLTIIEDFEERHNRRPITRLMRWLYGY